MNSFKDNNMMKVAVIERSKPKFVNVFESHLTTCESSQVV
jgi:hypothetical protein